MAKVATKKSRAARRTNAERSATTRSKLIDAAIEILYESGYSATTTIEVAKRARVSRGAMLHQFPTRVALLLAVAQHVIDANSKYRHERLFNQSYESGLHRFFSAVEISWDVIKQPSAIALLEIIMATRSDAELRKGFAPFVKNWREARRNAATRMATDLGTQNIEQTETLVALHQASLRGLAIELMFTRDIEGVERARELLSYYDRLFAQKLGLDAPTSK